MSADDGPQDLPVARRLRRGMTTNQIGVTPDADEVEMLEAEGFPGLLRTGRWFMAGIETAISLLIILWYPNRSVGTYLAMGLLLVYNIAVLWILYQRTLTRLPVRLTLALDLLFLAHVSYWTGGIESPFLGQAYLVIFVAALFYDWRGGLLSGAAAAAFSVAFGFSSQRNDNWEIVRDTAPYFVIVGGYTGFLVGRTKLWFQRYRETVEREREREREEREREREREREERQREREEHEREERERERNRSEEMRRRELDLARAVQRSSLPTVPPVVDGIEIAIRALPSQEVGGDFHIFLTDPGSTRLGVAVGDVAGKGMAAALVATSIGYMLPHMNPMQAPHSALLRLNQDLARRLPDTSFASLLYAEMNPLDATLTLWNAGHPPALLWRARGGAVFETPAGDAPPLGLFDTWSAPPRRFDIFAGDTLMICSDGILEARDADGALFGEKRLQEVFGRLAPRGPEATASGIIEAAQRFGTTTDDLTVIVCQRMVGYPGIL